MPRDPQDYLGLGNVVLSRVKMPSCNEMKMNEVYVCESCGLELKVVKECSECGTPSQSEESCGCAQGCSFDCCGNPMKLR